MAASAFSAARPAPRNPYRPVFLLTLTAFLLIAGCAGTDGAVRTAAAPAGEAAAPVREAARPLTGRDEDYDPLMDLIGGAWFVLLGDATHGTHEFYRERARITLRLIREQGFDAVAIEGDWDDAERVGVYGLDLSGAVGSAGARLPQQFDAVVYFDETRAVERLATF